nr:F-box family protein [Arabidopsis thaliana]
MKLYIIDVFSEERIDLPPLESLKGSLLKIERVGEDKVRDILISDLSRGAPHTAEDLRGRLWVGDKKEDYVVVWHFEMNGILII